MKDFKILLTVLFVNLLLSCAWVNAKPNQFETDAEILCSLYNPSTWEKFSEEKSGYEIYQNILGGIEKKIISKEVKGITTGYKGADFNSYYDHVLIEMERLLSKPWMCEHFENFHRPKVEVTSIQIKSIAKEFVDPYSDENIIISISSDNKIFINDAQLKSNSSQLLKKALQAVSKGKDLKEQKVYLYLEDQVSQSIILEVFRSLNELSVSKIGLVGLE